MADVSRLFTAQTRSLETYFFMMTLRQRHTQQARQAAAAARAVGALKAQVRHTPILAR